MRWTTDPDQPTLFQMERTVPGTGEFRGTTFHEIESRRIINHLKNPGMLPFEYTINPYRGCTHACVYCFARPTHSYLDLDIGTDFDSQIVVKVNAPDLLRYETAPGRWGGHHIAMGTNTDPYQRPEGRYRLTRQIIEVLVERGNPFSILTKGTLVLRDLDLLTRAARNGSVRVDFSVATVDPEVWRATEPGTPHPARRLEAAGKLNAAGVESGILIAPVLPGISEDGVSEVWREAASVGAEVVGTSMLHLRGELKAHYLEWLEGYRPDLVTSYRDLYRNSAYLPRNRRGRRWKSRTETKTPSQLNLEL
ncbi:MAG: radical SAM protein [Acidimicrobiia bacterium]|nr:radical SAM protein [Acidimicrobiia bacterium]